VWTCTSVVARLKELIQFLCLTTIANSCFTSSSTLATLATRKIPHSLCEQRRSIAQVQSHPHLTPDPCYSWSTPTDTHMHCDSVLSCKTFLQDMHNLISDKFNTASNWVSKLGVVKAWEQCYTFSFEECNVHTER